MVWTGKMEVTGLVNGPLAILGDVPVPPEAVMTFQGTSGAPDVTMRFRVRDGRPECVDISVRARDDGRGIRSADVSMFNIDTLTIAVFEELAWVDRPDEAEVVRVRREISEARLRSRGVVTREELELVAKVYRENVGRAPTEAVVGLGYTRRTAARRIKQAEEADLLPTTTQGKRRQ